MSEDLVQLRKEMTDQFSAMRSDIKEISHALVELVRLEGKFERVNELVYRLATENDNLEKRLRSLENSAGINNNRISNNERIVWFVVTSVLGLGFAALKSGLL